MQTPDRKQRGLRQHSSRLALKRGIHRTREREDAADGQTRQLDAMGDQAPDSPGHDLAESLGQDLPDPMAPPPTVASIVRARGTVGSRDSRKER